MVTERDCPKIKVPPPIAFLVLGIIAGALEYGLGHLPGLTESSHRNVHQPAVALLFGVEEVHQPVRGLEEVEGVTGWGGVEDHQVPPRVGGELRGGVHPDALGAKRLPEGAHERALVPRGPDSVEETDGHGLRLPPARGAHGAASVTRSQTKPYRDFHTSLK